MYFSLYSLVCGGGGALVVINLPTFNISSPQQCLFLLAYQSSLAFLAFIFSILQNWFWCLLALMLLLVIFWSVACAMLFRRVVCVTVCLCMHVQQWNPLEMGSFWIAVFLTVHWQIATFNAISSHGWSTREVKLRGGKIFSFWELCSVQESVKTCYLSTRSCAVL